MATRKNTFLLKRSNVAGNIPTAGQIQLGELALNTADVKLYASGTTTNSILPIGWDRISRTGDTMTGTLYAPTISATTYQNLPNDLPTAGTTGQILAKNSNTNYDVTWIDNYTSQLQHTVKAGVAITKGQAVYVTSANGTNMIVGLASNTSEATSSKTLGLLAQDLALNGIGFVVTEGLLAGLNTGSANAGDPVWLGINGNLIFGLLNKPVAPAHLVYIGVVTRAQTVNGEIFVKPQNGFEFNELHDVLLTGVTNGDLVSYNSATSLWKNSKTLDGSYNVTGTLSATTISAATYLNLPTDVRVTGGTYSTGSATFTNNTGGTFTVTGFNTGTVTGVNSGNGMNFTNFTTSGTITMGTPSSTTLVSTNATTTNSHTHAFAPGGTTAQYITGAGTLVTFPTIVNTFVTGATVNNSTYDLTLTRNDGVTIVANLGILATDVKVTGGTYNPTTGVVTFTNTTGGTFNVTGFSTGMTDTFVTGGTYAAGTATFTRSNGATFNVTGFNTGTVTSVAALTLGTSGTDLSSTVANGTTTPVITLNVPDASATARGVITTGVQTIGGVKTFNSQINGTVGSFSQSSAGTTLYGYNGGTGGIGVSGGAGDGLGGYFVNNSSTYPVLKLLGLSNTRLLEGRDTSDVVRSAIWSNGDISGTSFIRTGGTAAQFLKANGSVDSTTYVPTSRTLTINGTAFDLSANRSWTIGGFTGGTVTGPTIFTGGVTANTISATTVIANNFTGLASLATSATTALNSTNATNSTKIFTANLPTTDVLVYPTFVDGYGNNRDLYVDSNTLTYNPSSNILTLVNLVASGSITATTVTANNFTGLASLATSATTALNSTNTTNAVAVGITNNTTTNATYYPTFVDGTSGNKPLQVDSSTFTFNPSTNTLTVANLAGLASQATSATTALNATNASYVGITEDATTNADFFVTFANATNTNSRLWTDSARLRYNPSIDTLYSENFVGLATNATQAVNSTNVGVTNNTTTNATYYLTFASGVSGNQALNVDSSTLTFNPSTNTLTVANLSGLASLATSATTALNATNATTTDKIDNINFRNSDQTSPISAPDTLDSNGVGYVTNINLYGQIDGALYAQAYSSAWQHQIFGDYRTGQLAVRGKNSGTWQSWRNILDSTNFTNYAVPTGRTLTINGTTFDLSANRSWTITSGGFTGGTVTGPTNFTAGLTANTISATTVTVDTLNATNITGIGGLQNYVAKFSANGPFIGNSQIYDNGTSVGINTTSPSSTSKLDVNGVIRGIYMADPTTGETTAKFLSYSPSPYGLIFRGYSSGAHSIQSQREGNDSQLYPLSLQPLGGSVGINTLTPTVPLDVNGEALVRGPFTVSGSPTNLQYVRINSDLDLFNGHIDEENYGTFSRLRLSRASGTQVSPTTPASGTAVGRLEFGAYNTGTGTFIMNAKVEAVMDATTGANDLPSRLAFFTTPDNSTTMAEVMRINSLGNMRIGGLTMALSDVINVENGSVAFQNGYGLRFQSTGGTLYASVYSNNNDTVIKSLGDAIRFKNRAGTANRMSILDGGFVGINTNTPNQWLDVNGDALINGLTVGLGNSAYNNAVLGNQALGANTTGYNNVAIHSALPLNTTGTNNVGIGYKALFVNTIGNDNVAVGVGSLQLNTSGIDNISIGTAALYNNDDGGSNIAIGKNASFTNVNGGSNVAMGYQALYFNTGNSNLALGHFAGYTLDGSGNNIIGTSNNQLPDANDLSNQQNTLSISKHTEDTKGMPHFWAPDSIKVFPGTAYILEADPQAYSAVFIDYSLEDQSGNLRAGTLKAIFTINLGVIKWDEVTTSDIGSTSNYTFNFIDNGSTILGVELTNSGGGPAVFCNYTSRLISRSII